ncbi:MAG: TonB-dependent receptor [Xanthomonadaceae bacterium]|nr:TonB-dependent receptor [Xanthomonadaceae bacterium]
MQAGLQYNFALRDNDARLNDVSGTQRYRQWNPRLGLLYKASNSSEIFANLNRIFEPPSIADLTAGGALDFTPLKSQTGWTGELGSRGQASVFNWDISIYRSELRRELLKFGEPGTFGFVAFTENAGDTIHQGLELGLDTQLLADRLGRVGHELIWRNVYTFNDFNFDNDPDFSDNDLAGVPRHVVISELRFEHVNGAYLALNVRWIPRGQWADFANTTRVPDYALLTVNTGFELSRNIDLYVSAENITDKRYISNVTTNANQLEQNGQIFTPGQGRGVFAGLNFKF